MRLLKSAIGLLASVLLTAPASFAAEGSSPDIAGIWQGALTMNGGIQLRLVLHVSQTPEGAYTATLDSIDQGANGLSVDTVTFQESTLHFEIGKVSASYIGTLNRERTAFTGRWTQGPNSLPLTLTHADFALRLNRPQGPKRPFPYEEQAVTYENEKDHVTLAGTLTLPSTSGPFPGVLLITGSGSQDRDESLLGHKPFLVLSDYLTRRGLAVLRVDDRGVGGSSAGKHDDTSATYVDDVLAGVEFLKAQPQIDARRIGLIGHSEGGMIAPMAAIRSNDIAFIVMMAGPGAPGDVLLARQGALIGQQMGFHQSAARAQADGLQLAGILKEEKDDAVAEQKIRALLAKQTAALDDSDRKKVEEMSAQRDANIKMMLSPWFRFFLSYDPRVTLEKVKCPVLAITGERDLQVDPKQNLPEIEAALRRGGNRDFTVRELKGLNHLLQAAPTGAPSEYGSIEETLNPQALQLMGDWLMAHAAAGAHK